MTTFQSLHTVVSSFTFSNYLDLFFPWKYYLADYIHRNTKWTSDDMEGSGPVISCSAKHLQGVFMASIRELALVA